MLDRALIILLFQQIDYNRFSNHQLIREIEVSKHAMERIYRYESYFTWIYCITNSKKGYSTTCDQAATAALD